MSGENIDSDVNRSRSIFRQVRDTFSGINRSRHRIDARIESPPYKLTNKERKSADNIDLKNTQIKSQLRKSTPISFTHHLSLLNQVKSHLNKPKKSPCENNDFTHLSLPSMNSLSVSLNLNISFECQSMTYQSIVFSRQQDKINII